ncbi:unnamed protein product [Aureobasidium mustum]|uniref:GmrSD restriction endonucleases C-terminal domain-containing protein n=1 Tax=Aureobasidium mustum TaxID=2773714 RepID=A0A9N8PBU8_9PEZI|nr:unnamed protein product [Aureobasidium mustum]
MISQSILLLAATAGLAVAAPIEIPLSRRGNLPEPVSAATAIQYLSSIKVAAESNSPAYDRDLFKHWITISGACNTRETVLKRDGTDVTTSSACAATSGAWYSDYDGKTWTAASDLDIDHLVPLKEAWVSGAKDWTNERREQFANDLNQAKGDQDLAEWLPPRVAYQCEYVRAWVQVKYYYGLTMDSAEKAAASNVLTSC